MEYKGKMLRVYVSDMFAGFLIGPKQVWFSGKFLLETIGVCQYCSDLNKPIISYTGHVCPLCEKGEISLVRVIPVTRNGDGMCPQHISNTYSFLCKDCGGYFSGRVHFNRPEIVSCPNDGYLDILTLRKEKIPKI
jgi:hypothetical protein